MTYFIFFLGGGTKAAAGEGEGEVAFPPDVEILSTRAATLVLLMDPASPQPFPSPLPPSPPPSSSLRRIGGLAGIRK